MERTRDGSGRLWHGSTNDGPAAAPGKMTLAQGTADPGHLRHEVDEPGSRERWLSQLAGEGTAGVGVPLPHLEAIQRAFGSHDVRGVQAHTGGAAQRASVQLGARAFAFGSQVAFGTTPDLHTAAHEAAHVVQQRGGVQLKDGIGAAHDEYERHADAVADKVVRGESAEALLDSHARGGRSAAIQRREYEPNEQTPQPLGPKDWTEADRVGNTAQWQTACMTNLEAADASQYVKIVERRDFYSWFYNYACSKGFECRWALAASLVADGAHQVADMDAVPSALLAGAELQGALREGNQIIFDNVLPKLRDLIHKNPHGLQRAAARQWDMQTLAEEQTLVQPMYAGMSPGAIAQMRLIASKGGLVGFGASLTHLDAVMPGQYNRAGVVPAFSGDIASPVDRWRYGMTLGNEFSPHGTGYTAGMAMPAVSAAYTSGAEFARLDTRHALHQLDALLNPNRIARLGPNGSDGPSYLASTIHQLTPFEQQQVLADRDPDGRPYSHLFAMLVPEVATDELVRAALPADPALRAQVDAFMARFHQEQAEIARSFEP